MSSMLSAEEKNKLMSSERSTMKLLFEGAMKDDVASVKKAVLSYVTIHDTPLSCLGQFKDGRKRTALHFAAQSHAVKVLQYVQELAAAETDKAVIKNLVNAADDANITPLSCACMNAAPPSTPETQLTETIDLLLAFGADPFVASKTGATSLHHAAGSGALALLDKVELTAEQVNKQSDAGTPLHYAACSVHANAPAIIEKLAQAGADPNSLDTRSIPPLIIAVAGCRDENSSELIVAGADVGNLLQGGITVAHIAADNGLVATLAALAASEGGRSLFAIKNDKGELPIELAAYNGYFSSYKVLSMDKASSDGELTRKMEEMQVVEKEKEKATEAEEAKKSKPKKAQDEELPPVAGGAEQLTDAVEVAASKAITELVEKCKAKPPANGDVQASVAAKQVGNAAFVKKNYDEAIDAYSAAIALYPIDHTYYGNRSACYMAKNDYASALKDAICCRVVAPEWQKGAHRLASVRLALGRFEDAAVAAWEGVSLNPGTKEAEELKSLMKKCVKEGKVAEAEKAK
jgi:ankyrin repeat protein